jgi:hypothetical protein
LRGETAGGGACEFTSLTAFALVALALVALALEVGLG